VNDLHGGRWFDDPFVLSVIKFKTQIAKINFLEILAVSWQVVGLAAEHVKH
jgi:hypothetical protein